MNKVCIIGLGYIGLPTACVMAMNGLTVHGVDIDLELVDDLKKGKLHIYEPDLDKFVKKAIFSKGLTVSTAPIESDVFILAVPTPFKSGYKPDLSYVKAAANLIAPYIKKDTLVVLESTSPVGTTEKIGEWLCEIRSDLYYRKEGEKKNVPSMKTEFFLAHCPERVLPGKILSEIVSNDRIIGGVNMHSAQRAKMIYEHFVEGEIILTDTRTAEMAKLTENAFRDLNIAFANELSMICDRLDIDIWELIQLANRHPRVNILEPGPGVGGHCIAVDPWFIVDSAPDVAKIITMAREVNDYKPAFVLEKIRNEVKKIENPVVAILGLSFKADVDDLRESPAIVIAEKLVEEGLEILAVEPYISMLPPNLLIYDNVRLCELNEAIDKADIIVGLVNHKSFYNIDKALLRDKTVIDTRGIWR